MKKEGIPLSVLEEITDLLDSVANDMSGNTDFERGIRIGLGVAKSVVNNALNTHLNSTYEEEWT